MIHKMCSDCSLVPDVLPSTQPYLMHLNKDTKLYHKEYDSTLNFVTHYKIEIFAPLCIAYL